MIWLPVRLDSRLLELILKGWFHQHLLHRLSQPFWSLQKILDHLTSPLSSSEVSAMRKLEKALFLVVLAMGYRASQLAVLMRYPARTTFTPDGSKISLVLLPAFVAKN